MELIRSNRTEALADALASKVRAEPLPPFQKDVIVVQSRGMQSWLSLALAERLGIWANPGFPFPRHAIERVLEGFSQGPSERAAAYDRERLQWTVATLLRQSAPPELRSYLGDPSDTDRVFRFAESVARVFDGYVVYRPDYLARWASGGEDHWQAKLWRQVVARLGPHDLASRIAETLPALGSADAARRAALQRLHLFSLETLPPLFLRFFSALSEVVPTTLYLLEPSSEYLGDVDHRGQLSLPMGDAHGDGHTFLSRVGRLSQDFQQLVLGEDASVQARADLFQAPERTTLLRSVQADILELRGTSAADARQHIPGSDRSISMHACTGPMREVHVLHDLVRDALEEERTLEPEDIVVMTPNLDEYAPLFRAVFGQEETHRIPFEVHDRKSRQDASFYDDFMAVLDVLDSRFSVLDLVRLMDAGSMRSDFRFPPEERSRIADLLAAAGVRWGIDAEHRAEHGLPPEDLHTWSAGLGRLFLGFASMPDATEVFAGLLPRGAPSLQDAELMARLSHLCGVLFDVQRRTRKPLEVGAWADQLGELCGLLFDEDYESGAAVHVLRTSLEELRDRARQSGFSDPISLKTLRRLLGRLLVEKTPAEGFLRRGVTLTELVPLRSVPFRMVCLVGMSEDAFPRSDDRPRFDLTRDQHRPGDRNKRHDDRHSFLQALLCARDRVIITYSAPGGSLRTGPSPSPVVWELCESIQRYYRRSEDEEAPVRTVMHPLHSFDRRCFDGTALPRSFSDRYLRIAQAVEGPSQPRSRIELSAEETTTEPVLSVGELSKWIWNPTKAFIDQVLLARFETSELYEPTGALTGIGPLDAANVGNRALRAGIRGAALRRYLDAAPEFPDGRPGDIERDRLAREIEIVDARTQEMQHAREGRSVLVSASLADVVLEGRIEGICEQARVSRRFTRVRRRAELTAWIEHLLMQAAEGFDLPVRTDLVLRGTETQARVVSYRRVGDPRRLLAELLDIYRSSHAEPRPLLGGASLAFAARIDKGGRAGAIKAARAELVRQRKYDPRIAYALGHDDPFEDPHWTDQFHEAAVTVYGPLFEHRSEA